MRKFHLFGIALVAVCAFSALVTASAFALTTAKAEWLANGNAITTELLADSEGGLLFENALNGGAILCEGSFEGTVGPGGADLVTMVVDLSGRLIGPLEGEGLLCTSEKTCEAETAEIWPLGLPWKTEAILDTETGLFYELIEGAEYHILCLILALTTTVEELCLVIPAPGDAMIEVLNLATDVEAMGAFEPLAECNGNAEEGLVVADEGNLTLLANGETLAISN